jgi:hypothetical protein
MKNQAIGHAFPRPENENCKCIVVTAAESMACDGIAVASLPKAQGAFGVARESGDHESRRLEAS